MDNWRDLIQEGELETVLDSMAEKATAFPDDTIANAVSVLSTRLKVMKQNALRDTVSPEETGRERNRITQSMLELIPQFAKITAPGAPAARKGITEQRLKQHILFLTFLAKAVVLLWLLTHYQAGGYSFDQFTGILTLLVPVFATYLGLMFQDFLDNRHLTEVKLEGPRIRSSVQWTIYCVIALYGLVLCWVIGLKPAGSITFASLSTILAIVESFLGIYLSRIVRVFFKTDSKP